MSKDMWDSLSIKEKADVIKVAIRNGVVGLPEIRERYNSFAGGGYTEWLEKLSHKKSKEWGIPQKELYNQMLNDETYSYETFYNSNREDAEKMLTADPNAHFNDSGKTYLHPTYSDESKVSNQPFKGGHWSEGPWGKNSNTYTLSKEQIDNRWDIGRTMDYLSEAEDNGVVMRMPNGELVRDERGNVFGGVLPAVEVNKYGEGGDFDSDNVLERANRVYTNYEDAKDFDMNPLYYGVRNYMYQNGIPHSGLSNCTLTATQWVDPNNPIKSAKTIVTRPSDNGYYRINQEEVVPGDLMISENPKNGSYHTMLVESVNKDGSPNLRYSTGGPGNDSMRYGVSQKEYHDRDNKQGGYHTEDMFYRYRRPNEVWLPEITVTPNKKNEGGNLYWEGGYKPSEEVKKRIAKWEGKAMTESTIDPLSKKKVGKNRSFEAEARDFVAAIPESIRLKMLSNQALADNLYSYSYNVGAGAFKSRVVPALVAYYSGNGNADGIANSMWASGDKKLRGLRNRRAVEKAGVLSALSGKTVKPVYVSREEFNRGESNSGGTNRGNLLAPRGLEIPMDMGEMLGFNSQPAFEVPGWMENGPTVYKAPVVDMGMFAQPSMVEEESVYDPQRERLDSMQRMNNVFAMMGMESPFSGMEGSPLMMLGNISAMGGNMFGGGGDAVRRISTNSAEYRDNLRKQRELNAAGYSVKEDGSWGPWQQGLYKQLYGSQDIVRNNTYSVKSGDSLWKIAKENNTDVQSLINLNPQLKDPSMLHIGDAINLGTTTFARAKNIRDEWEKEAEMNKDNMSAIQGVKHNGNYVVVDKANNMLRVFNKNNKEIFSTQNISTGKSGNDYNTITYVDENGHIISGKGNESTPAGITQITGNGEYHGFPSFTRGRYKGKDDDGNAIYEDIASSFHYGSTDNKKASNGCVRVNGADLKKLQSYIGKGTDVYTLPEKGGSYFKVKDGKLNFVADNPYGKTEGKDKYWDDYNTFTNKSYSPLHIVSNTKSEGIKKENEKAYLSSLMDAKKSIQERFNIDSDTYNHLAELALGIAEQETKYGTSNRKALKDATPDWVLNTIRGNANRSRGITQIKLKGDNEEMQKVYKELGINDKNINDASVSALATIARLAHMYNTEVRGIKFTGANKTDVNPYDALLYKWMGRNEELTKHTATPLDNIYIKNVHRYANNYDMYSIR